MLQLRLFASFRRPVIVACVIAPLVAGAACRDSLAALGPGLRGRTSADQLFGALADRHVEIARNAKYEYAKLRLSRGALSPSRVYDDTAAWTSESGPRRTLDTFGAFVDNRYLVSAYHGIPLPMRPADGTHHTSLTRLSDNEYRWDTSVDFAIGSVRPADVSAFVARLLTGAEGLSERDARAQIAHYLPHASAAAGSLFAIDSLHTTALPDGSTALTLGVSLHSETLRRRMPAFAEYVKKYYEPARYRVVLADRSGAVYLDATGRDRLLLLHLRSQHGRLVPLTGPPRPIPDTLTMMVDFKVKVRIFTVGFHDLHMELVSSAHGDSERFWTVTARREPGWDLPFITARLLRAPLRRPFAGEGAMYRMGVRTADGTSQTLLTRQARLTVQESAILNFLNGLGNTAMDDYDKPAERERNLWVRELALALREDARAALP